MPGRLDAVANEVVATAGRLGGSATKGLPDKNQIGVLVDLPANRESEFRAAIAAISGGAPSTPAPNDTAAQGLEKKSFVIQIVEPAAATQK